MLEKDGADKKVTTRWKYFRMDPKAFMTMGILKVRFFMEFMRGGFDVLCADLDVIWLKDPTPWLTGEADPTALLVRVRLRLRLRARVRVRCQPRRSRQGEPHSSR